ncbi:MAG: proline iminopeptidase-family hydrolase [Chloroflexi bacterium]|nr:proline iminopeptidase-family hydrolase [Chloroflexota bacterium]
MPDSIEPSSEGYVSVPGGRVWYQIFGAGDAVPLVALHGGPGSTHFGMEPLMALSDERPVILYDQLGCGKSDRPEDTSLWRIERFVEELAALRNQLGLERFHILGHSWGATLAMDYFLSHPQGIVSIVFSSPCLSVSRWVDDCNDLRRQLPQDVQATLDKHEKAGTTDSDEYAEASEVFLRRHVTRLDPLPEALVKGREGRGDSVYETMWGANEFYMTGNLAGYDRSENLKDIDVPTLFSCGRADEATPRTTEWFHSLTPGSEFVVYENSAHMPQFEESERYISVVREFIKRAER